MSPKEYIESGILEAYVLGNVTGAERAEVQAYALRYPEVQAELDAIEGAMQAYAQAYSAAPSAGLKKKVMAAIRQDSGNVRQLNRREEERLDPRSKFLWSIAASVLLMLSLGLNIYLYNRTEKAESYVNDLVSKSKATDSTMQALAENYKQAMSDMQVLKDPMYKIIPLKGQKAAPQARAMVCWCPGSKEVYFETEKMPEPPKGMQYQLWAIVDGKPVDEGMITMSNGLHKMKNIADATAFAVTLEKQGGSDTPHGDMVVMGDI